MGGRGSGSGSGFRAGGSNPTAPKAPTRTSSGGFEAFDDSQSAADALGWTNGGDTDNWLGQLTQTEEDTLTDYTDEGYRAVNRALRDFRYMTDDIEERTWALDSAIDKYTLSRGIVTHRGVGADVLGLPRSASAARPEQRTAVMTRSRRGSRMHWVSRGMFRNPSRRKHWRSIVARAARTG